MPLAGMTGRDRESAAIVEFLASAATGPATLLVEGEPGIGKTTLWRTSVAEAERSGFCALVARPSEPEQRLAYAALADLVAPVVDDLLPFLATPQRAALEVALLRAEPESSPLDPRAVGVALQSILTRLAIGGPVFLAVDDAHCLDRASANALTFAVRRLRSEPVRLVAFQRPTETTKRSPLAPLFADASVIRLGPLSVGAMHELLKHRLGHALPRPKLLRLHEACGGNPFFALELAHLLLADNSGHAAPLPMPADLSQLLVRRIGRLHAPARETLLIAAASAKPTVELIATAAGPAGMQALEEAEMRGVLEVSSGEIRFSHPLLAAAVYSSASQRQRQRAHRRLAEVAVVPEERARHLALSSPRADEVVAQALEEAASSLAARAAPADAAELMELACDLTPDGDVRRRRRMTLAELTSRAGDAARAIQILEALIADAEAGPTRARGRVMLAAILHYAAGPATGAVALCETALNECGDDRELQASIHTTLALVAYDDFRRAARHARRALQLLESLDDPDAALHSKALHAFCAFEVEQGRPLPPGLVERGLALERRARPTSVADRFSAALGAWLKYTDDFEGARHWLQVTHQAAIDEGDDGSLPYALSHLPQLEIWSGNWPAAEEFARQHLALAEQTAQESQCRQARFNLAFVHAHQGRIEEARAAIDQNLAAAASDGDVWTEWTTRAVCGFLELSLGNAAAAAEELQKAAELRNAVGDVARGWYEPDLVESLLELGNVQEASRVLERYEARAHALGRHSALANTARCRALLAAAAGDLDGALAAADRALAEHEAKTIPFDRARSLLVKGMSERRAKRKAASRESLEDSLSQFDQLGAPLWAAKVQRELSRLGLRHRREGLTETEQRVAELAAAGLRNREVAAKLFMSPKTVEANLARAYRKLGVSSRAELGARLGAGTREP